MLQNPVTLKTRDLLNFQLIHSGLQLATNEHATVQCGGSSVGYLCKKKLISMSPTTAVRCHDCSTTLARTLPLISSPTLINSYRIW